jgi:hypothetical protein
MGYYQIKVSPDSKRQCTIILQWGKHQYPSFISQERRALIPRILDYARTHAAYRQIKLTRLKISPICWHIYLLSRHMCSTGRRPHTINYFNVYNRQMAIDCLTNNKHSQHETYYDTRNIIGISRI